MVIYLLIYLIHIYYLIVMNTHLSHVLIDCKQCFSQFYSFYTILSHVSSNSYSVLESFCELFSVSSSFFCSSFCFFSVVGTRVLISLGASMISFVIVVGCGLILWALGFYNVIVFKF